MVTYNHDHEFRVPIECEQYVIIKETKCEKQQSARLISLFYRSVYVIIMENIMED